MEGDNDSVIMRSDDDDEVSHGDHVYLRNFIDDNHHANNSVYVNGCINGFVYGNNADANGDNRVIILK